MNKQPVRLRIATDEVIATTIKRDLVDHGYRPFTKNIEAIHDAWIDRRVIARPPEIAPELPPGSYADWRLPDFTEIEDFEYKYCALFEKAL